ncbi:MAG: hypothetical protein ACFFDF_02775 [Candidatus Odinarchaeota archaeon]
MKKITEKQDDNKGMLSKEIKITDENMKKNYFKAVIIAFLGLELIIINLICMALVYIANIFSLSIYMMLYLLILVCIAIGFYGLCGIYLHKHKPEKYSKMKDEDIRRNYNKYLAITFFGFVSVIITFTFFIYLFFFLIPLGIVLGAYGLYGINSHKRKPDEYREILKKKLERKISLRLEKKMDRRKISIGLIGIGGVLDIIIGLTSLLRMGLMFGTMHSPFFTNSIGITFIVSGILAIVGALFEYKSLIFGGLLCLIVGILTIVLTIIFFGTTYPIFYLLASSLIFLIPTILVVVGGILGILEYEKMKERELS